jgi:acyl-CoA synthetase (AMP-forming)/AMP-acid ligase II
VTEFVRHRLASYKKPRHVVFVDELPRNAGNKVLKQQVVERVSEELQPR